MRIIGGSLRGRALQAPSGEGTRPTSDRTREAVFNLLLHASWAPSLQGARVLDLFAGSGAMGLEALSRGAAFSLFVETEAHARGAIRSNVESLGLFGSTRIHRRDATDLGVKPAGLGVPFDLVFADPPYRKGLLEECLPRLLPGGWILPTALVAAETAAEEDVRIAGFHILDQRTYGAAKITFMRPEASVD